VEIKIEEKFPYGEKTSKRGFSEPLFSVLGHKKVGNPVRVPTFLSLLKSFCYVSLFVR
jgi:hypothetical protein